MATVADEADLSKLRDPQRPYARAFGAALVLLGVLGFVPRLVTDRKLFGVFGITPLHNAVHLLTGLLGLALSSYAGGASLFDKVGSVLYLGLFGAGAVAVPFGRGRSLNLDWAGNLLHLTLGLALAVVGFGVGEKHPT